MSRVLSSVDELLAGATDRIRVSRDDGKSGSAFETLRIDGEKYFLKSLGYRSDWLMRITGDHDVRTARIWEAGIMDDVPRSIDHTVVGMAVEGTGDDAVLTMLMRDVVDHLVPEGDALLPMEQHEGFMAHLAELSASFWGWDDPLGLVPFRHRLRLFSAANIADELLVDDVPGPIVAAAAGWRAMTDRQPRFAEIAFAVHAEPDGVAAALAVTPWTFLHGDWKAGNLGRHPDGRSILLDWAYPGTGPCCWDLAWYLALNRARLPESKEATIERFRVALGRAGIDTHGWFDTQLALSLLAMGACLGWEKALGDDDELGWWAARVDEGAAMVPSLESLVR